MDEVKDSRKDRVIGVALGAAGCGASAERSCRRCRCVSSLRSKVMERNVRIRVIDGTLTSIGECVQADVHSRMACGTVADEPIMVVMTQESEYVTASFVRELAVSDGNIPSGGVSTTKSLVEGDAGVSIVAEGMIRRYRLSVSPRVPYEGSARLSQALAGVGIRF